MGEDLIREIEKAFDLPETDPSQYSPLALAYIGDNIYELVNRTEIVRQGDLQVQKLHRMASDRANARTQAAIALKLSEELTEEEMRVYLRGRNAAVYTKAKNATINEYHLATGLEALIGYLYLRGSYSRITELLRKGWEEEL